MRKLLTWLAVTLGIAALVRKLRQRRAAAETGGEHVPGVTPPPEPASVEPADQPQPDEPGPDADPADELRQKLAASRTDAPPAVEATPSAPEAGSVEERRAEVHEQARAALDEMRPPAERPEEG
jgi:hypothetical protein